ncbi:MAG: hypothetical protein ACN6PI_19420 [Sphingobacterium siyangense]
MKSSEVVLFKDLKLKVDKKLNGKNLENNSTSLLNQLQEVLGNILEKLGRNFEA